MVSTASPPPQAGPVPRKRFHLLLGALLGQLVVWPFLGDATAMVIQDLVFLAILLGALGAVRQSRPFPAALGLTGLCAASIVAKNFSAIGAIALASDILGAAVILLTSVEVARSLATKRRVDLDTVLGGLCVYLFIGALWYILFSLVGRLDPDAFDFTIHGAHLAPETKGRQLFFFSYVTLLTTGYGDIVPLSPVAQVLSVLEGIVGQFYLVFFMARLVGLHVAARQ